MNNDDPEPGPRRSGPDLAGIGELGLISRIRELAQSADPRLIKGIGDDAAVFAASDRVAITTDLLVEGVHFRLDLTPARLLGRKAISVNVSDLAAMAAVPSFAVLGLAAPPEFSAPALEQIIAGFMDQARRFGVSLIGGDVCRADQLVLAVTLIGSVDPPAPVYRDGAQTGDHIYVTGTIGDSALGLQRLLALPGPITEEAIERDQLSGPILRHLDPEPRLAAGQKLAPIATSMIDLSDGIISDLGRVLEESHVPGARIETARLPLSAAFREYYRVSGDPAGEALQTAVAGGEDYELLFTVRAGDGARVEAVASGLGTPVTRIGEMTGAGGISLVDGPGRPVASPGPRFAHF